MDTSKISPQTSGNASKKQPEADRLLWQNFIHQPETVAWIAEIIKRKLWWCDRTPETIARHQNNAWCAMSECKGYRIGKGDAKTYAIGIILRAMKMPDFRPRKIDEKLVSFEDPTVQQELATMTDARIERLEKDRAVQEVLVNLHSDDRRWAETFMGEFKKGRSQVNGKRPELIRSTQTTLGWSRHRCEKARRSLAQTFIKQEPTHEQPSA